MIKTTYDEEFNHLYLHLNRRMMKWTWTWFFFSSWPGSLITPPSFSPNPSQEIFFGIFPFSKVPFSLLFPFFSPSSKLCIFPSLHSARCLAVGPLLCNNDDNVDNDLKLITIMKIMLILLTFMLNREKISVRPIVKNANGHTVTVRKAPVHKNHFYVSLLFLITEWSQYGLYWWQTQIWRLRAWICFVVFFFARAAFKHKTKQIMLPFFDLTRGFFLPQPKTLRNLSRNLVGE